MKKLSPIAKVARETKLIMKHYQSRPTFKSQKPKNIKDFEELVRSRKNKKGGV